MELTLFHAVPDTSTGLPGINTGCKVFTVSPRPGTGMQYPRDEAGREGLGIVVGTITFWESWPRSKLLITVSVPFRA